MKIQQKFILIQCSFSVLLLTILVLLIQWSIRHGMVDYVNTKELEKLSPVVTQLQNEYQNSNNWSGMAGKQSKFIHLITKQLGGDELSERPDRPGRGEPPHRPRRPPPSELFDLEFEPNQGRRPGSPPPRGGAEGEDSQVYYVLFDANNEYVVGKYLEKLQYGKVPIIVNNQTVGYFAVSKRNRLTEGYELDYIEKQQEYLWIIALVMMLIVILITLPLARHVVEPIKSIAHGMHQLTQGNYKQSINLRRKDEFGELNRDYNELAITLAENESARKRWLANISHELRTPVAILNLELEAMVDGIRPMTKENVLSATDELKHLAKLIDDLHQLTVADVGGMQYNKHTEDITSLLKSDNNKYQSYLSEHDINLVLNLEDQPINIYCDKTRLQQLLDNIISNSIKYSEAKTVKISSRIEVDNHKALSAKTKGNLIILIIEDDGVGVEEKHLEHLFEYLYRTDESRNRKTGGTGLGLSICKNIVVAHHGEISASLSSLGGLAITIKLPIA